jgi:hypothetical protein
VLWQFHEDDACVRECKLTRVALEVVVLRNERCAGGPSIREDIRVGTRPESHIIGVFSLVAFTAEIAAESRR